MSAPRMHQVRGAEQRDLFVAQAPAVGPEGFRYQPDLITVDDEADLVSELARLPFEPFDFHGHLAHRQVVGFGYRYDYASRRVRAAEPIPDFLDALRQKVGGFTGRAPEAFEYVLINDYRAGAGIGWHRDKPQFEEVVGVSLLRPLHLSVSTKNRRPPGADLRPGGAALRLSPDRPVTARLGTQYPASRTAPLFDHLATMAAEGQ